MLKLGNQPYITGIEFARKRWNEFHPVSPGTSTKIIAWDQLAKILQVLRYNNDESIDKFEHLDDEVSELRTKVAALEARPAGIPFPGSG